MVKTQKIKEWLWRYLPAEIFATTGIILITGTIYFFTGNRILAAYTGSIFENLGYYSFISLRELKRDKAKYKNSNKEFGIIIFFKTIRNLAAEFGPSEILDTLIIRPFCIYWLPILISNYIFGVMIGKFIADLIFYTITITFYEKRKKYLKY